MPDKQTTKRAWLRPVVSPVTSVGTTTETDTTDLLGEATYHISIIGTTRQGMSCYGEDAAKKKGRST